VFNLKDLSCVVAVYEHGGFARAARVLGTVQSNVSARILRLERLIGAPLFVRLHRGTAPTAKGELLYRHAVKVLREVGELETVLRSSKAA
jgi:DNA-binding transcriptional LysR family regulator